jgi:hypothetical protein
MARNETKIEITAEDKTGQAFDSVKNKMNSLAGAGSLLSSSIIGFTSALSVGVFSSIVREAADAATAINDVAKANEVAIGSVLKLSQSLTLNGGDANSSSKLFATLTSKLDEAASGSEKAQVQFKKVGVSLKDLKTLDGQQLFEKSLAGLAAIEDPITRNATAMDLFGKAVKSVDIKGLAEDYASNNQNFTETERVFKEIGKAMDNVDKAQASLKLSVATNLGPWYADSLNYISKLITGYDDLENSIRKANYAKTGFKGEFKAAPTISDNPIFGAFKLPEEYQGGELRVVEEAKTKTPKMPTAKKTSGKSEAEQYADDIAKLLKIFDDAAKPAQTLTDKLQEQLNSYTDLDSGLQNYLQNQIYIIKNDEFLKDQKAALIASIKAEADAIEESNQRVNDMMEATQGFDDSTQELYNANSETYNAILRETQDINAALIENDVERARRQIEIEHERRLARIDLLEGEADQVEAIREAEIERYEAQLKTINAKTKVNSNLGKDLGLTFKSAFEDAIVEGKKFGDVLKSLEQDIIRILTRRIVTDPLTKGIDGILDSFEFNADGGVYNSPSLSNYSGQVVSKPTMFAFASGAGIMGEAGAEGIFPLKRGKDGKLGVSAEGAMGGGTNVVVNLIESPGNGGQVNQQQNGNNLTIDVMVEKIESMMGRNISQGRGIAPAMERQYGLNRAAGAY